MTFPCQSEPICAYATILSRQKYLVQAAVLFEALSSLVSGVCFLDENQSGKSVYLYSKADVIIFAGKP